MPPVYTKTLSLLREAVKWQRTKENTYTGLCYTDHLQSINELWRIPGKQISETSLLFAGETGQLHSVMGDVGNLPMDTLFTYVF